jgi:hypothetical protein
LKQQHMVENDAEEIVQLVDFEEEADVVENDAQEVV